MEAIAYTVLYAYMLCHGINNAIEASYSNVKRKKNI